MINDYELLKETGHSDLEELFSKSFAVDESKITSADASLYNTFPIDASQEEVMRAVRKGESCVVQGPPGTGKFQRKKDFGRFPKKGSFGCGI